MVDDILSRRAARSTAEPAGVGGPGIPLRRLASPSEVACALQFLASDARATSRCQPSGRWRATRCDRRTVSVSVLFVVTVWQSRVSRSSSDGGKLEQHRERLTCQRAAGPQPKSAGSSAASIGPEHSGWQAVCRRSCCSPSARSRPRRQAVLGGVDGLIGPRLLAIDDLRGNRRPVPATKPAAPRCTARSPGFATASLVAPVSVWCNWFAWSPVPGPSARLGTGQPVTSSMHSLHRDSVINTWQWTLLHLGRLKSGEPAN